MTSQSNQSQIRSFVFTLNNPSEAHQDQILMHFSNARYIVIGQEVGAGGTPHLQGYVQLEKRYGFNKIAKLFPWHIEATRGTPEEASNYCKKDGNFREQGELCNIGNAAVIKADHWKEVLQLARAGQMEELQELFPSEFIRYNRSLNNIRAENMNPQDCEKKCVWLWGKPGTGKSRFAFNFDEVYPKMCNKWWDGFKGQRVVVIDEFEKSHACLSHHLKIWADRHPFINEIKTSAGAHLYDRLIVTSNYAIEQIWPEDQMIQQAVKRRFREYEVVGHSINPEGMLELEVYDNKKVINNFNVFDN